MRLYDYVASANCYKVRLLLAQLGRDYERVPVDIFDGPTLTDDFARLNPLRSTPVLELDDGRVLLESNAILWYLAHGTDFLPVDPFEQAAVARGLARPAAVHVGARAVSAERGRPCRPLDLRMSGAGYSGTRLPKKLGIKEDARVALVGAPPEAGAVIEPLPPGVVLRSRLRGEADVIVFFPRLRGVLE